MPSRLVAKAVLVALIVSACQEAPQGPTHREIVAQYRDRLIAKKEGILEVFRALPQPAEVFPVQGAVGPFWSADGPGQGYNNIALFEAGAFVEGGVPEFSMSAISPLSHALDWLGDSPQTMADEPADADFTRIMEDALATPFVGLYATAENQPAVLSADGPYTPGRITVGLMLVELAQGRLVASCSVSAENGDKLEIKTDRYDATPDADLLAIAGRADLTDRVQKRLAECLADQTGGKFNFY